MKRKAVQKPYWEMTLRELEEATKDFDGPVNPRKLRPLTKKERRRFERAVARGSASIKALCRPPSLNVAFDERFLRVSMIKAAREGTSLYDQMESSFIAAAKWFERTWTNRRRRDD
jgi:hypothetical protein